MIQRTTLGANGYDSFILDLWLIVLSHQRYQTTQWVMGIPILGLYLVLSNDCGPWRFFVQRMTRRRFRNWLIVRPPWDRMWSRFAIGKTHVDLIAENTRVVRDTQAALDKLHPWLRWIAVADIKRLVRRKELPACLEDIT